MTVYTAAQVYQALLASGATSSQAIDLTAIAEAESSFDPDALGDSGTSFGLWQIHSPTWDSTFPGGAAAIKGAPLATQAADALVVANSPKGLSNWSTYTSGAYNKFLANAQAAAASITPAPAPTPVTPTVNVQSQSALMIDLITSIFGVLKQHGIIT